MISLISSIQVVFTSDIKKYLYETTLWVSRRTNAHILPLTLSKFNLTRVWLLLQQTSRERLSPPLPALQFIPSLRTYAPAPRAGRSRAWVEAGAVGGPWPVLRRGLGWSGASARGWTRARTGGVAGGDAGGDACGDAAEQFITSSP